MTEKQYKRCLKWGLSAGLMLSIAYSCYYMDRAVPDRLNIVVQEEALLQLPFPFRATLESDSEEVVLGNGSNIPADQIDITRNQAFRLYGKTEGSYRLGVDLFGLFRFKEIQVEVVDETYAVPCGAPVGIYLESDGVMVIGTGAILGPDGNSREPAAGILKSGDYIEAINGKPLSTKEELQEAVAGLGEADAVLTVRRGDSRMDLTVTPAPDEQGEHKIGAWVRSDTQGIGTMTYLKADGSFGALGHGISDTDTGELVEISDGELYTTEILGIEKGEAGKPGVMSGVIYYGPGSHLGDIGKNTDQGIFGTVNQRFSEEFSQEAMEVGYRQDVKKGPAVIRSGVSGEIEEYEIEILKVDTSGTNKNKSIVLQVTDSKLLSLTGGIVQGMSGSPIIQDGKIIGAVTHVFVQDSTKGYGIFIENMLEAAE